MTEKRSIAEDLTKDPHLEALIRKYFSPEDYAALQSRKIGTGSIGGKACGMLLAQRIAERETEGFHACSEPDDSFYIGADVFSDYIRFNGAQELQRRQRTEEGFFPEAEALREKLRAGRFPEEIREQLRKMLEHYGQNPLIVRSSGIQEDGFGNAFAGKYVSVFCINQGSIERRLQEMEDAVRAVYASAMDPSALAYRRRRGLDRKSEAMAVLIQRVSGRQYGDFFFPAAAGVGYSRSIYRMFPDMDPAAGMLRLVMGLGTRAVERTGEDYPRLANLDRPEITLSRSSAERHCYSQHGIDTLDLRSGAFRTIRLREVYALLPQALRSALLERDTEAEAEARERGEREEIPFISCSGLLAREDFTDVIRRLLKDLEAAYGCPVDIEYAINLSEAGDLSFRLLQCRPLWQGTKTEPETEAATGWDRIFFELEDSSMGASGTRKVDAVVRIDPVAYYECPYAGKYDVVSAINAVSRHYDRTGKRVLLLAPGRLGTSSPELGVPVGFRDIAGISEICEVSESRAGYRPELSYGSHFFQDLVESEIRYHALCRNRKTLFYEEDYLAALPNLFPQLCPELSRLSGMISVTEPEDLFCRLDANGGHTVCGRPKAS